ncbi:sulfatase [Coraliomargarita sp. W4R72]
MKCPFLIVLVALFSVLSTHGLSRRPNVLFILADDLGWMDTAFQGSDYFETPHLDQLAKRGMVFTHAYAASPLCSPTRASLLTGQYPGRLKYTRPAGHYKDVVLDPTVATTAAPNYKATNPGTRTRLPLDYWTLAKELKSHDYSTAFMGKWHLGRVPYVPEAFGFDTVIGGREHPGPPEAKYFGPWDVETLPVVPEGTHIADVLADEASSYIEKHRDEAFFLCLWFYDVHAPFQAKPELLEKYRQKSKGVHQQNPEMGAMIETMDTAIGRVLATLDRLQLNDETIIIFTSDNGGNMFDVVDGQYPTSNYPLRGGKGTNYEGGVRVPLSVTWPGAVAHGQSSDAVVTSPDFFPTILELAGLPLRPDVHLDGQSFAPALQGEPYARDKPIYSHFPHPYIRQNSRASSSVTEGDWKLYRYFFDGRDRSDRYELYHLSEDVSESNNLALSMPERVEVLSSLLDAHLQETGALLPALNTKYNGNTMGVWNGNDEVKLNVSEGVLLIDAPLKDPQLTTPFFPSLSNDRAILSFEIQANHSTTGDVYWTDARGKQFNRNQKIEFQIDRANEWQKIEVDFIVEGRLEALRLDPINTPGQAKIRNLKLISSAGVILREWAFE